MRDRSSLSRYRGMASLAPLPQKRTSGSDGLDAERKYKFNFEIKLRSVEEKEAFKRRLSKVRGLLIPPCSSKPHLDILRESRGLDGFTKIGKLSFQVETTHKRVLSATKCFTCKQRLLAGKR